MKAKEIQELIDFISKSGLDEVNIETEEFKIKVKKNTIPKTQIIETSQAIAPVQTTVSTPGSVTQKPAEDTPAEGGEKSSKGGNEKDESNLVTIKSPMIGTFYRSSNPDTPPFVSIGDTISTGQTVCIVEAMKLFNEIEAEISGTVVKVLVENASPVEYDQPLFLVDPA